MSVLQRIRRTQLLQLQSHCLLVIAIGNEGLALPHCQVLLGKKQRQEAWNDHPVACGTRVANPVDLSMRAPGTLLPKIEVYCSPSELAANNHGVESMRIRRATVKECTRRPQAKRASWRTSLLMSH